MCVQMYPGHMYRFPWCTLYYLSVSYIFNSWICVHVYMHILYIYIYITGRDFLHSFPVFCRDGIACHTTHLKITERKPKLLLPIMFSAPVILEYVQFLHNLCYMLICCVEHSWKIFFLIKIINLSVASWILDGLERPCLCHWWTCYGHRTP